MGLSGWARVVGAKEGMGLREDYLGFRKWTIRLFAFRGRSDSE